MIERTRLIIIDEKKCIGCRACTSTCPEERIHFSEERGRRNIYFPESCTMDCELCALACPDGAITFVLRGERDTGGNINVNVESVNIDGSIDENVYRHADGKLADISEIIVSLKLMSCSKCRAEFATIKEIEKVRKAILENVPLHSGGDYWLELCTGCRRAIFREKEAGMLLKTRNF